MLAGGESEEHSIMQIQVWGPPGQWLVDDGSEAMRHYNDIFVDDDDVVVVDDHGDANKW